jgi:hypothetical protein
MDEDGSGALTDYKFFCFNSLIFKDLIDTDGKSITFTDPIFSIWFKRKG